MKNFAVLNLVFEVLNLVMHIVGEKMDNPTTQAFICLNRTYLLPTTNLASLFLCFQSLFTWFFLFIIWYTYYYIPSSMSVLVLASNGGVQDLTLRITAQQQQQKPLGGQRNLGRNDTGDSLLQNAALNQTINEIKDHERFMPSVSLDPHISTFRDLEESNSTNNEVNQGAGNRLTRQYDRVHVVAG